MSGQIKVHKRKGFTAVPNEAMRRADLSWKAKGLLAYMLGLDESWKVFKADLKNRSKDGYDSTVSAFDELEKAGYVETVRIKDGNLFNGYEYIIYDEPIPRARDFPETGNPLTGNPQLINNSLKKINKEEEMKIREVAFKKSLNAFVVTRNNPNGYSKEMLTSFADYWTEPTASKTKMRFELEVTWDTKRRLAKWTDISSSNSFSKTTAPSEYTSLMAEN